MTITKKHLKELADIVYKLSKNGDHDNAQELEGFARRHAPNFDQSRWDDHIYKRQQEDNKPEPYKQYRLIGKKGEASIARGNTWAESEIK